MNHLAQGLALAEEMLSDPVTERASPALSVLGGERPFN